MHLADPGTRVYTQALCPGSDLGQSSLWLWVRNLSILPTNKGPNVLLALLFSPCHYPGNRSALLVMCAAYVAWMERGRNFNITVMCICEWWEALKHLQEWLIQLLSIRNCYFVLHIEILSKDTSYPLASSFSPHLHSCEHATEVEMQQWGGKAAIHSDWICSRE